MTFKMYDSATRSLRDFEPLHEGRVGIYICGLTTQGSPHIGHVRFAVAFDVLRRWLTRGHGLEVTLVRNVTDIDDKILRRSTEEGRPWWAHSYLHERETAHALELLGVIPPTYEPRATGHVTDMVELMRLLIDRGHAYSAPDGSGDVYFDVRSWQAYGELTRQGLDDMEPAADADPRGKRDPRDFALWKGRKDDEPATASWPTPWGEGRPGWHLECSAMARRWLGDSFDIHGGGLDLRFPHHENEQAQSRAAGLGFARYWMHNAWVTVGGEKMSKSLGNSLVVSEMARRFRPLEIRYLLTAAHYRSMIEYTEASMTDVAATVERLEGVLERVTRQAGATREELLAEGLAATVFPDGFAAAMDEDLNVSGALAVVFDHVRRANQALDGGDAAGARELAVAVVAMTDVLGVNPLDPAWAGVGAGDHGAESLTAALDALVQGRLAARAQARADKDWARADAIRDELAAAGLVVEDSPAGARWSLARTTPDTGADGAEQTTEKS